MNRPVTWDDILQVIGLALALVVFVLLYPACKVPEPAVVQVQRQADLSKCRHDSEKYRDAGPDAEWSAYKACTDGVK